MSMTYSQLAAEPHPFANGTAARYAEAMHAGCTPDEMAAPVQSAPWNNCANKIISNQLLDRALESMGRIGPVPIAPVVVGVGLWFLLRRR